MSSLIYPITYSLIIKVTDEIVIVELLFSYIFYSNIEHSKNNFLQSVNSRPLGLNRSRNWQEIHIDLLTNEIFELKMTVKEKIGSHTR